MRWVMLVIFPIGCLPAVLMPDREYPRVASEPRDVRVFQCVEQDVPKPCPLFPPNHSKAHHQPSAWWRPRADGIVAPVVDFDDPILFNRTAPASSAAAKASGP